MTGTRPAPAPSTRGERAERALTEAVLDLVAEDGFAAITVDKIANRAGVGKPTIYRRWNNKDELIAHVLGNLDGPDPVEPGDELRPALVAILGNLQQRFTSTRTGKIWQRLLGEAETFPDLIGIYDRQYVQPRRQAAAALLRHHVSTGTLRPDLDVEIAVDVLIDAMVGALLAPGRLTGPADPAALVDIVTKGMLAPAD